MADQGQIRNHFMSPEEAQRYTFSYFEAERVKYKSKSYDRRECRKCQTAVGADGSRFSN